MNRDEYPSVTKIISIYQDWSHVPAERLEAAAARGTKVHRALLAHARKIFLLFKPDDPEYGYFTSGKIWFDEYVEEVISVEERLYDDIFQFNGQPDLIARLKNGHEPVVIDYKTPITENKFWSLQLAGYRKLAEPYGVKRAMALMLNPNGKMALAKPYDSDADMATFIQMVGIHHYLGR